MEKANEMNEILKDSSRVTYNVAYAFLLKCTFKNSKALSFRLRPNQDQHI